MISVPVQITETVENDGWIYRIRVYDKTNDWKRGDLLDINNELVIFYSVELFDRKVLLQKGFAKWLPAGGKIVVYGANGPMTISAQEYAHASKTIKVISRFEESLE